MTATRPPVCSAEALIVARKPMNHSASPSRGCSVTGVCAGVRSLLIGSPSQAVLGPGLRAKFMELGRTGARLGASGLAWLRELSGAFGGGLELLKGVAHALAQLAVPVCGDVEHPGPGRDPLHLVGL